MSLAITYYPAVDRFKLTGGSFTVLHFEGEISGTPAREYPTAQQGDFYVVSRAGQVGGKAVSVDDVLLCLTTAGAGPEQSVGASWTVLSNGIAMGAGNGAQSGVSYEDQEPTAAQQEQARENIDAAPNVLAPATALTDPLDVTTLSWTQVSEVWPTDPFPSELQIFREDFDGADTNYANYLQRTSTAGESAAGVFTFNTGNVELVGYPCFKAPYLSVGIGVTALGGGTNQQFAVGIRDTISTNQNKLFAYYDNTATTLGIYCIDGAGNGSILESVSATLTVPFELVLVLAERTAQVWVRKDGGWRLWVRTYVTGEIETRNKTFINAAMPYCYSFFDSGAPKIDYFRAGYFGNAGLQNMHPVCFSTGEPMIRDGWAYFTTHANTPGGDTEVPTGVLQQHCFVYRINLSTYKHELVSMLCIDWLNKISSFGFWSLIFHEATGEFMFLVENQDLSDTFAAGVANNQDLWRTKDNLLAPGVHIVSQTRSRFNLDGAVGAPVRDAGRWYSDTSLRYIGSLWVLSVCLHDNTALPGFAGFPGLYTSPDLVTWTFIGQDITHDGYEGTNLQKVGGQWAAVYVSHVGYVAYDLEMNELVENTDVTGSPAPHICWIPVMANGKTRYLWVTMLGGGYDSLTNFSEGTVATFLSDQSETGFEFALKRMPFQ